MSIQILPLTHRQHSDTSSKMKCVDSMKKSSNDSGSSRYIVWLACIQTCTPNMFISIVTKSLSFVWLFGQSNDYAHTIHTEPSFFYPSFAMFRLLVGALAWVYFCLFTRCHPTNGKWICVRIRFRCDINNGWTNFDLLDFINWTFISFRIFFNTIQHISTDPFYLNIIFDDAELTQFVLNPEEGVIASDAMKHNFCAKWTRNKKDETENWNSKLKWGNTLFIWFIWDEKLHLFNFQRIR